MEGEGVGNIVNYGQINSANQYYPCAWGTAIKWHCKGNSDFSIWIVVDSASGGGFSNAWLARCNNIDASTVWKKFSFAT